MGTIFEGWICQFCENTTAFRWSVLVSRRSDFPALSCSSQIDSFVLESSSISALCSIRFRRRLLRRSAEAALRVSSLRLKRPKKRNSAALSLRQFLARDARYADLRTRRLYNPSRRCDSVCVRRVQDVGKPFESAHRLSDLVYVPLSLRIAWDEADSDDRLW